MKINMSFRNIFSRVAILDSFLETKKRNLLLMRSTSFGSAHIENFEMTKLD